MSPEKVQTIKVWAPPRSVKHVQQFIGFANFYRRFIEGSFKMARSLTELTKKEKHVQNAKNANNAQNVQNVQNAKNAKNAKNA
jgi:hypothetical protein